MPTDEGTLAALWQVAEAARELLAAEKAVRINLIGMQAELTARTFMEHAESVQKTEASWSRLRAALEGLEKKDL